MKFIRSSHLHRMIRQYLFHSRKKYIIISSIEYKISSVWYSISWHPYMSWSRHLRVFPGTSLLQLGKPENFFNKRTTSSMNGHHLIAQSPGINSSDWTGKNHQKYSKSFTEALRWTLLEITDGSFLWTFIHDLSTTTTTRKHVLKTF